MLVSGFNQFSDATLLAAGELNHTSGLTQGKKPRGLLEHPTKSRASHAVRAAMLSFRLKV
jgi:hypothetical protein